jgi:NAD(P)-dependent dehydrogenase (short-subunit alcohol dehydrogenase family)
VRRRRRPGVTLTREAFENSTDEYRAEVLADGQLSRLGGAEDIAAMVAFLRSDDGADINGETILVDGGRNFT